MAHRRNYVIAAMLPSNGIGREILLGFHTEAMARRWSVAVPGLSPGSIEILHDSKVDGAVIGPFTHNVILAKRKPRVPLVAAEVDLTHRGIPSVRVNDASIGQMAADHLLAQGFRHFAAFGFGHDWFLARRDALRRRVIARGAQFLDTWDPDLNDRSGKPRKSRGLPLLDWLGQLPRPVAILAGCDDWGRMLNFDCHRNGIRVPEDVAVIGVDNDPLICDTSIPPLSSVAVPWRKVGAEAVRLLADRLDQASPPSRAPLVLVEPSGVIGRQSSDLLAVADKNVELALRLIRERATERIGVPDILREVAVGRHALQRAFRRQVGRTMLGELCRVRVERAKTLLTTTQLPMPDIATRTGFSSAARLSVLFHRETGFRPGTYRRKFQLPG